MVGNISWEGGLGSAAFSQRTALYLGSVGAALRAGWVPRCVQGSYPAPDEWVPRCVQGSYLHWGVGDFDQSLLNACSIVISPRRIRSVRSRASLIVAGSRSNAARTRSRR